MSKEVARWVNKANCYGISQPAYEMAFGSTKDDEEPYGDEDAVKFAEVFCTGCPVIRECLEFGKNESHGVWGGKLPHERFGK